MDINKIEQIGKIGKIERGSILLKGKEKVGESGDILSISPEARKAQELEYLKNLALGAILKMPDSRPEKIDIATGRVKEGYYNKHITEIVNSLLNPSI